MYPALGCTSVDGFLAGRCLLGLEDGILFLLDPQGFLGIFSLLLVIGAHSVSFHSALHLLLSDDSAFNIFGQRVKALGAVRLPFPVPELHSGERSLACCAYKAARMPRLGASLDFLSQDGFVALGAAVRVEHLVVQLTVRYVVHLKELAIREGLMALPAHKVLGMIDLPHGRDRTTGNWFATSKADRLEEFAEAVLAEELPITLMAVPAHKAASAHLTRIVFRMHPLAPDCDELSVDWLLALGTHVNIRCEDLE